MKARMYLRIGTVAVVCATAGTLAGIATSSAKSTGKKKARATTNQGVTGPAGPAGGRPGMGPMGGRGPGGGAVHSVSVVPNQAGTGFDTVTQDSGKISNVDTTDGQITVVEGTSSATYQTLTITVPASAKIYLDGTSTTLDKLAASDQVMVIQSSAGTFTVAADDGKAPAGGGPGGFGGAAGAAMGGGPGGPGGGPGGFGGPRGPGGPGGPSGTTGAGGYTGPADSGGPASGTTGAGGWTGPQQ